MLHTPPTLFSLIWSLKQHLVRNTCHDAPNIIFFDIILLALRPKNLPQHPVIGHLEHMFIS
jgi:hypothetical protein